MNRSSRNAFALGMLGGVIAACMVALILRAPAVTPYLETIATRHYLDWMAANLGWSLVAFIPIFIAWFVVLQRLGHLVEDPGTGVATMRQAERVLNVCIGLFVSTGVIFTAIGMRAALIYALGEPEVMVVEGAYAILRRLVDGGILLALSTTIVGGIGGKLMHMLKVWWLGSKLDMFYEAHARRHADQVMNLLERIYDAIRELARRPVDVTSRRGTGALTEGRLPGPGER